MRLYIQPMPDREWFHHALVLESEHGKVFLDYSETYTKDPVLAPMNMVTLGQQVAKVLGIEF